MVEPPGLVWDACCLLNLMALNDPASVLTAMGCPCYVVREVRLGEALHLRPLPETGLPPGSLVPVDLERLIAAGNLMDVSLSDADEVSTFVALAAMVDDGEARSTAIASHRSFWLVTDDRAATRVASALPQPVTVVTTPEWLKQWSDGADIGPDTVADALRRVELCARYFPRQSHPLHGWWNGGYLEAL